jgi:predicted Zn-dependent protease
VDVKTPAAFLLMFCLISGCASAGGKKTPAVPPAVASEEVAIGEQIHAEILSSFYPYTEPKVVSYVNKIGNGLAKHAERKDLPYRFTILYNDKIYATSAPGGFIYVTTGLLYFLNNEAELAAVIAHEIGELQFKDPKLSRSRQVLEAVTRGGQVIGPALGEFGALALLGILAVNAVAEAGQPTPEERLTGSDARAMDYMVKAGYDPQGVMEVFYKFLQAPKELLPYFYDYYQSRPITEKRVQALQQHFATLPLEGKSFDTGHEQYREIMHGVKEIYQKG